MKRGAWLVLAGLFALAGCGSGAHGRLSRSQYEAELRAAFNSARADLGPAPHTPGSVKLLTQVSTSYEDIATGLKDLRPPSDVQRLNDRLIADASARAASLNALLAKLEGASKTKRQRLLTEYGASQIGHDDFDKAVEALEAKGYRFRPSAGT